MATLTVYEHLCPEEIAEFNQMAQRARLPLLLIHQESTGRGQEETGTAVKGETLLKTTTNRTAEEMNGGDSADPWKFDKETETVPESLDAFVNRWVTNELNHGKIHWRDECELYRREKRMKVAMTYFKEMRMKASYFRAVIVPLQQATVPERPSGHVEINDTEREGFEELVRQGIPKHYIHQEMIRRELKAAEKQPEIDKIRTESKRRREQERINIETERQRRSERIKSETRTQRRMRRMRDETLQWNGEDREAEERKNNLGRIAEETESKLQLESLVSATTLPGEKFTDFTSAEDWIRSWIPKEYSKQKVYDRYLYEMAKQAWARGEHVTATPETPDSNQDVDSVPLRKRISKCRTKAKMVFHRFRNFTREAWRVLSCKYAMF